MKDAQKFIALLFLSRDFAHKAHFNTNSFAVHSALGSFYESIVGLADNFAEVWMGRNGKQIGDIPTLQSKSGEPLDVLKQHLDMVQAMRDFVGSDTVLNNLIDEIESEYSRTIYKLQFLK